MNARLKHGAWTWVKTQNGSSMTSEVWTLSEDCIAALGTRWVLKDYGPGSSAFSGWRLVSGGPFGPAHATMLDAAEYARTYLNDLALGRKRELQAQIDALEAVLCS